MKIAFLSAFAPYLSQISEGNMSLYRTLEKSNETKAFNFSLLYPEIIFPNKEKELTKSSNFDYTFFASERILNSANPASYLLCANAINFFQPQLFLTRYWMPYLGASIGGTAKFLKKEIKKIAIVDSVKNLEKQVFEKKSNSIFANNFDAFIVFENQVGEDLLEINSKALIFEHPEPFVEKNNIKIDKEKARKILNIPKNKKVMLIFSPIRQYFGIDIILNALAKLDENFHTIVAGETIAGIDFYERKVRDLNISEKVTFIARKINENEKPYIFSAADILLLPNQEIGFKNVIDDIFNYNLPLISANFNDLGVNNFTSELNNSQNEINKVENNQIEKIVANKLTFTVKENSADAFAELIEKYFAENLEKNFKNQLQEARYFHSWESLATLIYDIYDQISDKKDMTIY
jgi:glycosyltransferase involved in cell wall biosynthesis